MKRGVLKERPENFRLDYSSPLAQGLVFAGLGRAPGSLTYRDSSAFGNHGTLTAMEPGSDWQWVPKLGRWGLTFDGDTSTEYVKCPAIATSTTTLSVFTWVNTAATGGNDSIMAKYYTTTGNRGWMLGTAQAVWAGPPDGNELAVTITSDGASPSVGNSKIYWVDTNICDSVWRHVGFVWDNGVLTLYIDFVAQSSTKHHDASFSAVYASTASVSLSAVNVDGTAVIPFPGTLADSTIHNRALTLPEIQTLADPNPMLGGLILPPRRRIFPTAGAALAGGWFPIYTRRGRTISAA